MPTPAAQLERQRRVLLRLAVAGIIVNLCLLTAVIASSYYGRRAVWVGQVVGCERGKRDRADNADGWVAHRQYIDKILAAHSVMGDVKAAAVEAEKTYDRIVPSLRSRTGSRLDCHKVYPAPPLFQLYVPAPPPVSSTPPR